jgi:hypothetical protein
MSEPADGWTVDTLRLYLLDMLAALDRRNEDRWAANDASRLYLLEQLRTADARLDQRFDTIQEMTDRQLIGLDKASSSALAAAQAAITKAEQAAERRFEGVNEFRGQLADQAATFLPRSEANARIASALEKIDNIAENRSHDRNLARESLDRLDNRMDERLKDLERAAANMQGRLWALGVSIAGIVIIVNIAIRFIG